MGTLSLTLNLRVLCRDLKVDQETLDLYGSLPCFVLKNHLHYKYYGVMIKGKRTYLHRLVCNLSDSRLVVDHINGDTTDNRKENLRVCTNIENTKNLRKQSNGITSKYKGVSYYKRDGTWEVNVAGHSYGRYPSEWFAAYIYNQKATLLFGEFARLNDLT